jgi:hypothetical protein
VTYSFAGHPIVKQKEKTMRTRMLMALVALIVAMMVVVPASADGPTDKKPAPPAGKGALIGAAAVGSAERSEQVAARADAAKSAARPEVQAAIGAAPAATDSTNATTIFGGLSGQTRIYQGNPNSNVYVQGKTSSAFGQPRLYDATYACKTDYNHCTAWGVADYNWVSWVTYTWHYVDAYLKWYYGRSYHWGRDIFGSTSSFYTSKSGWY